MFSLCLGVYCLCKPVVRPAHELYGDGFYTAGVGFYQHYLRALRLCIIRPPIPWALARTGNELGSREQDMYKKCEGFCISHSLHILNHPI